MLRTGLRTVRASAVTRVVGARFNSSVPVTSKLVEPETAETRKNDDRMIGDYPDVKPEFYQHRNPYLMYDEQQNKRNTGEPVYHRYDLIDVWSPDRYDFVSNETAVRWFGYAVAGFVGFSLFCYNFVNHEAPAVRRSYPHEGLYKALGGTEEDKEVYQARVDA